MERLQADEVRKASEELGDLTNIFVEWGNELNNGRPVEENLSPSELSKITRNSSEFYRGNALSSKEQIHDDFSLSGSFNELLELLAETSKCIKRIRKN